MPKRLSVSLQVVCLVVCSACALSSSSTQQQQAAKLKEALFNGSAALKVSGIAAQQILGKYYVPLAGSGGGVAGNSAPMPGRSRETTSNQTTHFMTMCAEQAFVSGLVDGSDLGNFQSTDPAQVLALVAGPKSAALSTGVASSTRAVIVLAALTDEQKKAVRDFAILAFMGNVAPDQPVLIPTCDSVDNNSGGSNSLVAAQHLETCAISVAGAPAPGPLAGNSPNTQVGSWGARADQSSSAAGGDCSCADGGAGGVAPQLELGAPCTRTNQACDPGVQPESPELGCVDLGYVSRNCDGTCEYHRTGWHPTGGACVAQGTLVTLADRRTRAIEKLKAGDRVWNPLRGRSYLVKELVPGEDHQSLIEVKAGDQTLLVNALHPFSTQHGLVPTTGLRVGDTVRDADGKRIRVYSMRSLLPRVSHIFNLIIDAPANDLEAHLYLTNGIVTGDLVLQRQLLPKQTP